MDEFDWLRDIPETGRTTDIVEIRFKNTRKAFYRNVNELRLKRGDIVAVEASPGHDIGIVCLTGELVLSEDAVLLTYGNFFHAIIDFLIIALAIFLALKVITKLSSKLQRVKDSIAPKEEKVEE